MNARPYIGFYTFEVIIILLYREHAHVLLFVPDPLVTMTKE